MARKGKLLIGLAVAVAAAAHGCGGAPNLDTETFELQYLDSEQAAEMVLPYVYDDRPDAAGVVSHFPGGITVRETRDNLAKIARVLEEYDRPKPGVRLMFQIIAADGPRETDPRIAQVESVLRDLFRFDGYGLVGDVQMAAVEGSSSSQVLEVDLEQYFIAAHVQGIRGNDSRGAVELHVELGASALPRAIQSSMTVPIGQTVVLGSAKPIGNRPTLILTVRPQLVSLPE